MKKSLSVIASAMLLGGLFMTGCGSNSSSGGNTSGGNTSGGNTSGGNTSGGNTSGGNTSSSGGGASMEVDGSITIRSADGTEEAVDPTVGATVCANGSTDCDQVVVAKLNKCTDATKLGSRVACGPIEGLTYVFQSDFAKLGPLDSSGETADGGVLLYDAQTEFDGVLHPTPVAGYAQTNRIGTVYIPTNYIVLDEQAKSDTVQQKYDYMREYLDDICNMKCMFQEFDSTNHDTTSEPFFTASKTKGRFVATYVMQFSRGISEENLNAQFADDNKTNLEFLSVTFELDVEKQHAGMFKFSTPKDSKIVFGGKKAGADAIQVETTNKYLNLLQHAAGKDDASDVLTVNMARYFDKLIVSGASAGQGSVAQYAKEILVENATNPWPVKIYGTLHEIIEQDAAGNVTNADRSFVRNPAKLDAKLFNLDVAGPYRKAFHHDTGNHTANAQKFVLVYPGGAYNKLD